MNVKAAVRSAMEFVADIFEAETLQDVRLEEVYRESDSDDWVVTVSFVRKSMRNAVAEALAIQPEREYKHVVVSADGNAVAIRSATAT